MHYDELLELAKTRRTIRVLKPDPVPMEELQKALEVARWAPTGFNLQPAEFLVFTDPEMRAAIKKIIDDWIETDFYALEATREPWQGPAWGAENKTRVACPEAPVYILIVGDTRRKAGLPMNARHSGQKADSIFETSLADAFAFLWLGLHSAGLGAQPVSAVKNERPRGLLKHYLGLPDYIYTYEMLAVGYSAYTEPPPAKLMRHYDEMVHVDASGEGMFPTDDEVRKQIRKLRMGNVARHAPSE